MPDRTDVVEVPGRLWPGGSTIRGAVRRVGDLQGLYRAETYGALPLVRTLTIDDQREAFAAGVAAGGERAVDEVGHHDLAVPDLAVVGVQRHLAKPGSGERAAGRPRHAGLDQH